MPSSPTKGEAKVALRRKRRKIHRKARRKYGQDLFDRKTEMIALLIIWSGACL